MGTVGIALRLATLSDAEPLATLAAQTFRDGWASVIGDADAEAYAMHYLTPAMMACELADLESYRFLVATAEEEDETLLGYTKLDLVRPAPDCVTGLAPATLQRLYVTAAARGTGVADKLFAAITAEAIRRDRKTLWLECDRRNERAWHFYERRGFISVGTTVYYLPNSCNDRVEIMVRSIP